MIIRFWYCDAISLMVHLFRYFLLVLCIFIVKHMHANRWKLIPHKPRFYNVSSLYWSEKQYYKVRRSIQTVLNWTNHYYLFERWRLGFRVPEPRKFPEIRCNGFFYQVRLESVISIKTMSSWNYYTLLRLNPRKCKLIETVKSQDPFLSTTAKKQFKLILILKLSRK